MREVPAPKMLCKLGRLWLVLDWTNIRRLVVECRPEDEGTIPSAVGGEEKDLHACLEQSQGGTQINTAYIERLNATVRERLASLTRKCRHANWHLSAFQWGCMRIGCTYNLCWIHQQLDQTPAMAAGLTDHAWSLKEVLTYKVPPHLLAKAKEDELQELAPPLPVPRFSQCVRGNPSPAYLALRSVLISS